ncbi:MAG: hypothetical protein GXZ05_12095 [Gammaproteobacteria bacterium]|nr:hypothetical protein [Thiopseudomonas sp.]NLY17097.1 hypothetical protein [Gammaproteobacteria bacterium]
MSRKATTAINEISHAQTRSDLLEEQRKAFLKQGGKIEKVPTGQSGQQAISYFGRGTRSK